VLKLLYSSLSLPHIYANTHKKVGDDIEVFYSEEGSKCFQHALSREDISTAIKFKLGTSPLPMSMLPPWATVVGTSTSAVRRNNGERECVVQ
jgi:hypothetical protein